MKSTLARISDPRWSEEDPLILGPLLVLSLLGVLLRLVLLLVVGQVELQSDEANYVYGALTLNHFGVYLDHYRYLWPPGYSWILAQCIAIFGQDGLFVAKLLQVVGSASIGLTTMLFAYRLGNMRAARIAGVLWVLYLPLAAFTHLLWNETLFLALFLPALYQLLRVIQGVERGVDRRLIAAGLLLGAALYLKEAPVYLVPLLALGLLPCAPGMREGLARGALLLLACACVQLPWTLRNLHVYGHFVPVAQSLGENAYNGLNEDYRSFDLIAVEVERTRRGLPPLVETRVRPWFVDVEEGSGWERADRGGDAENAVANTIERSRENTSRGLAYAREHPGWLARSRLKKLADLVTPLSFFTRHQALGRYDHSALGTPLGRALSGLWAVACPVLVLLLGSAGFFALREPRARWLLGLVIGYTVATSTLVAMSRFRLPIVPLLIACGASLLARRGGTPSRGRAATILLVWGVLGGLWWINWPETSTLFAEMVWRVAP